MPARRLPWFKMWPEFQRHEKVVLLTDAQFRTWMLVQAAASEQALRWRFASVKHAAAVTGRPAKHITDLIAARLLDLSDSGEVWVHNWRKWQLRHPSDFPSETDDEYSANAPRTLPENGDPSTREERRERREERGEKRELETTPQPPGGGLPPNPPRGARQGRRRNGSKGIHQPATVAAPTEADCSLWAAARERLQPDMNPANFESVIKRMVPIGRAADGGMHLRAPPGQLADRFRGHIARALAEAGDPMAKHVAIVD